MAATTERGTAWHFRVTRVGVGLLALGVSAAAAYDSLPAFFMALAAIMVVLALVALFQSLRTAFGDQGATSALRVGLPERAALLDEKNVLLRAIKDIAFEREVGKLSDADFARLDRAYRHRAKEVLRKLDEDIAPFLDRAERLVESVREPQRARAPSSSKKKKKKAKAAPRRDCPACATSNAPDAAHCKECGASVVPLECGACGAMNEADAKFCKKCASPLQPITAASTAPSEVDRIEGTEPERARGARRRAERGASDRGRADHHEDDLGDRTESDDRERDRSADEGRDRAGGDDEGERARGDDA